MKYRLYTLKYAKDDFLYGKNRDILSVFNKIELDSEVEWFEVTLEIKLDKFAKVIQFTSFSKR